MISRHRRENLFAFAVASCDPPFLKTKRFSFLRKITTQSSLRTLAKVALQTPAAFSPVKTGKAR
jgi:hypothetical protein